MGELDIAIVIGSGRMKCTTVVHVFALTWPSKADVRYKQRRRLSSDMGGSVANARSAVHECRSPVCADGNGLLSEQFSSLYHHGDVPIERPSKTYVVAEWVF